MQRYWDGDGTWLAIDALGHVAVLTTAGVAPIPTVVLDNYQDDSPEDAVNEMPVVGGYDLHVRYPRPDDFIAFAARGFFAYDWRDAHRVSDFSTSYELIASPNAPILATHLQPELLRLARLVTLVTVTFDQNFILPIERLFPCEAG